MYLILNPENGNEYETRSFMLDLPTSSYRTASFNSGDSPFLYIGTIDEVDVGDPGDDENSYTILKISKDLINNSDICTDQNDTNPTTLDLFDIKVTLKTDIHSSIESLRSMLDDRNNFIKEHK